MCVCLYFNVVLQPERRSDDEVREQKRENTSIWVFCDCRIRVECKVWFVFISRAETDLVLVVCIMIGNNEEGSAPQGYFCLHNVSHLVFFVCFSVVPALHTCRSAQVRTAAASLQEDMGLLLGWLDKAEGVLAIPLQPAEPQHIRDTLGKVQVPLTQQTAVKMNH